MRKGDNMFTLVDIARYVIENYSWEVTDKPRPGTVHYRVYVKGDGNHGYKLVPEDKADETATLFTRSATIYDIARDVVEYVQDMDVYGYFTSNAAEDDDERDDDVEDFDTEAFDNDHNAFKHIVEHGSKMMFRAFHDVVESLTEQVNEWIDEQDEETEMD